MIFSKSIIIHGHVLIKENTHSVHTELCKRTYILYLYNNYYMYANRRDKQRTFKHRMLYILN